MTLNSIEIYGDNREEGGVLRTILDPNAANGTYQWYRSDSKDGVYTPIDGANDSKYTITYRKQGTETDLTEITDAGVYDIIITFPKG